MYLFARLCCVLFVALHSIPFFTKAPASCDKFTMIARGRRMKNTVNKICAAETRAISLPRLENRQTHVLQIIRQEGDENWKLPCSSWLRETGVNLVTQACHGILVKWKLSPEVGHNLFELDLVGLTKIARNKHKFIYCAMLWRRNFMIWKLNILSFFLACKAFSTQFTKL